MTAYGNNNNGLRETPEGAYTASKRAAVSSGARVTYSVLLPDGYVLSGFNPDGTIFYERQWIYTNVFYGLNWTYPNADQAVAAKAVDHSSLSFVTGGNTMH